MTAPWPLTELDEARIEAEAMIATFEEHRAHMDPASILDRLIEKALHRDASIAQQRLQRLEAFDAHADAAIDLTGGAR